MASGGVEVRGTEGFRRAVRQLVRSNPKKLGRGLIRVGLFIQRESQKIVPVDTSFLKASAYTRHTGQGKNIIVRIGYQTSYAVFVHEMLQIRHKPGKTAKFLERPLIEKTREMTALIEREMST